MNVQNFRYMPKKISPDARFPQFDEYGMMARALNIFWSVWDFGVASVDNHFKEVDLLVIDFPGIQNAFSGDFLCTEKKFQ